MFNEKDVDRESNYTVSKFANGVKKKAVDFVTDGHRKNSSYLRYEEFFMRLNCVRTITSYARSYRPRRLQARSS